MVNPLPDLFNTVKTRFVSPVTVAEYRLLGYGVVNTTVWIFGLPTNNEPDTRPDLIVGDMVTIKDSESGNPVAAGEWKPEDVNQLPITATGNRLWNYFLDLYERTLKVAIDAFLRKVWPT